MEENTCLLVYKNRLTLFMGLTIFSIYSTLTFAFISTQTKYIRYFSNLLYIILNLLNKEIKKLTYTKLTRLGCSCRNTNKTTTMLNDCCLFLQLNLQYLFLLHLELENIIQTPLNEILTPYQTRAFR